MAKNPLLPKRCPPRKFFNKCGSPGILDDFAVRKNIDSLTVGVGAGVLSYENDRMYVKNVSEVRAIDRSCCVITETTEVVDTTTETTIYTGTIGANALRAGNIIKLFACGELSNVSASDDITMKIYLGTTEVLSFKPAIGNVTDEPWSIKGHMTCRTTGASGTMAYHMDADINGSTTRLIGLESVDTTASEDFTVTVEWDNAKADNTIKIYQGWTEWKN